MTRPSGPSRSRSIWGTLGLAALVVAVLVVAIPNGSPLSIARPGSAEPTDCATAKNTSACLGFSPQCYVPGVNEPDNNATPEYTDWECILNSTLPSGGRLPANGWLEAVLEANGTSATRATTENFVLTDGAYVGDYYAVYEDSSGGPGPWKSIETTAQLYSGPQLIAPTYDRYWVGNGTAYSQSSFGVHLPAGSFDYFFTVRDLLLAQMASLLDKPCKENATTLLSKGCHVPGIYVAPGWDGGGLEFVSERPPAQYTVDFNETGLKSAWKTNWCVTFNGTETCTTKSTISFGGVTNGTHSYTIGPVANYSLGGSYTGTVTVDGGAPGTTAATVSVPWTLVKYKVTFTETGLAKGTDWTVTLGSSTATARSSTISISISNGT
jgi:hypothetical protein